MSSVTKLEFKDGDDGGEFEPAEQIVINVAENGYIVTIDFYDNRIQYVYQDSSELLKEIKRFL